MSTYYYLQFLASSWPSWGVPSFLMSFRGESPAPWGSPQLLHELPGAVPSFPGPSWGAHSKRALLGNLIAGSHTMCCQLWLLRPRYTCWIQGPGLSNLISSFVPTFWVPWWYKKCHLRVCRSERSQTESQGLSSSPNPASLFPPTGSHLSTFSCILLLNLCNIMPSPGHTYQRQFFPIVLHHLVLLNQCPSWHFPSS